MIKKLLLKIWKFIVVIIISIINYLKSLFKKTNRIDTPVILDLSKIDENKIYDTFISSFNVSSDIETELKEISKVLEAISDTTFNNYLKKDIIIEEIRKIIILDVINDKLLKKEENKVKIEKCKSDIVKIVEKENIKITLPQIKKVQKDEGKKENILYVISTNKTLKDTKKKLEEITSLIKEEKNLNDNKDKIDELKEKLNEIRSKYYEFKHSKYIYELENDFHLNEIDEFKIINSSTNIDLYLKKCDALLNKIDLVKNKPIKKDIKKEVVKITKQNEKTNKEIKKVNEIDEYNQAYNIILLDVRKKQKKLDLFELSLLKLNSNEKKQKRLNYFDTMLLSTTKIGISLMPYKLLRRRSLGILVTGYMLNNSVRSLRRILNNNLACDYIKLSRMVKNELDVASAYERVFNDSLYQVSILRDEFTKYYGDLKTPEILKMYDKLDLLEQSIIEEIKRIQNRRLVVNKVKKIRYK